MTPVGGIPSAFGQGPLIGDPAQKEAVSERKCPGWSGGVVGDRTVGSVDEINRETRRDQNGVHGPPARRTARRESERP